LALYLPLSPSVLSLALYSALADTSISREGFHEPAIAVHSRMSCNAAILGSLISSCGRCITLILFRLILATLSLLHSCVV